MNNIRELRKRLNFKVADLANILEITPKHFYDLETGKRRLNETHIRKLSETFGVSASEILGGQALSETPDKPKKPKDLLKILEQEDYTLNGRVASPEDKERLAAIIEAMYWDAKKKNKRK